MKKLGFLALLLAFSFNASAASFDCAKASTLVEKTICSDSQLSNLDDLLMQSYKKSLANSANPDGLKSEQRLWLTNERNKCPDVACLKRVYNQRLTVLNTVVASGNETSMGVTGTYKAEGAELKIQQLPGGRMKFQVFATWKMNTGEAAGEAPLKETLRCTLLEKKTVGSYLGSPTKGRRSLRMVLVAWA